MWPTPIPGASIPPAPAPSAPGWPRQGGWQSGWSGPAVPPGAARPGSVGTYGIPGVAAGAGAAPARPRAPWPQLLVAIVITALITASLSAGATYFVLSPNLAFATPSLAPTPTPTGTPRPTAIPTAKPTPVPLIDSTGVARLAAAVEPAVVTVVVRNSTVAGSGSGFVVSANGSIITNYHVVDQMTSIYVTFRDGHNTAARVLATDPIHDLAVIRVVDTGLAPVPLGKSVSLEVGDTVIAFGNPLGEYPGSVTIGVVSGLDRDVTVQDPITKKSNHLAGLIQTDVTVTHGNSGGPLVDSQGQVVGVIVAGDDQAPGINFAVPIDLAQPLLARAGGL